MQHKPFTKSDYTLGLQCPRAVWLKRHMPEAFREDLVDAHLTAEGDEVGELARRYYGEPVSVLDARDGVEWNSMCTSRMIASYLADPKAEPIRVFCEATFASDGLMCMVDVLRVFPDGTLGLTEVKSSTKPKPYHYDDIAFQVYVIEQAGYTVSRAELMHVNSRYVRHGELDLEELFTRVDMLEEAHNRRPDVKKNVAKLRDVLRLDHEPGSIELHDMWYGVPANGRYPAELAYPGPRCACPHKCGFFGHCCLDKLPEDNVFRLQGASWGNCLKDVSKGIVTMGDALAKKRLSPFKRRQVEAGVHVNVAAVKEHLGKYSWPILHLDFETINPAIPPFDDVSPYQQVPTQYSLHIMHEDGTLEHREFLGREGTDPRRELAESLVDDIPTGSCTVAYNKSFEKGRIVELAKLFPDLRKRLLDIVRTAHPTEKDKGNGIPFAYDGREGLVDLMEPFQKGSVYLPAMGGSYSIKYVLPALFPDDPSLDYHNLKSTGEEIGVPVVRKGDMAAAAWLDLSNPSHSAEWVLAMRRNLLQYCELDTYAMVKVFEALQEMAEGRHWTQKGGKPKPETV